MTIGPVGALTLDDARKQAGELRADVARGLDPAEEKRARVKAPRVNDLAERFMKEHAPRRTLGTRRNYASLWNKYLVRALGSKRVAEVRWEHLAELHHAMRSTPYMANRMLALASKAWNLAKKWGWYPRELENPARDHDRFAEHRRGQALSRGQIRRIGEALQAEPEGSIPAAALMVLMLTGCRPVEILNLRWEDLEGRLVHLPTTKTGPRTVYLGAPAAAIIEALPRLGPFVFAGREPGKPLHDLKGVWRRVRASGYVHPRPEILLAEADKVAGAIWEALSGKELGTVLRFPSP